MSRIDLTDAELEIMRLDAEAMMPDTCVIQTVTNTSDGAGGWTATWAASGTALCRIDPRGGRNSVLGGKLESYNTYQLTLPWDTTINANNRVVVNSQTFSVVAIDPGKSWSVTRRAVVERV